MLGFGFNGWVFALNFDFGFWGWEILNFWALELGFDVKRNWCCQKVFFFFFFKDVEVVGGVMALSLRDERGAEKYDRNVSFVEIRCLVLKLCQNIRLYGNL